MMATTRASSHELWRICRRYASERHFFCTARKICSVGNMLSFSVLYPVNAAIGQGLLLLVVVVLVVLVVVVVVVVVAVAVVVVVVVMVVVVVVVFTLTHRSLRII